MSDETRVQEIRARHTLYDFGMVAPESGKWIASISCKGCHRPWPCEQSILLARLDALEAENEAAWQTLARERDSWQAEANRLTAERDELRRMEDIVLAAAHADIQNAQAERDAHEAALNAIWATAGAPEGLSPLQAVERLAEAVRASSDR